MKDKKYFFGWFNIKSLLVEIIKMYTNKTSFFSKKRIESGIAFVIGQYGMLYWLNSHILTISSSDMFIWAGVEFAIAGYIVNQIQKEKKPDEPSEQV